MKILIDSSAWIEYLEGSTKGEKVREIFSGDNELYVLNFIISEVISKIKRKNMNEELAYRAIITNSKVLNLTPRIAKNAGLLHAEMKKKIKDFGLADALILATAREMNMKVLTEDKHFKKFKEAVFLS